MFLATQYYRPPFPDSRYWADDLARIRDAGIQAVQLWCVWGWIESEPGVYRYDDYDRLIDLAAQRGLKLVLSTIAEIHPFWIHRVVPGSEMIDHMGNKVVSSPRIEVHQGLTPGGCFDNPRVWQLMSDYLTNIAARYTNLPHLLGWDCWNETRWNVQADGHVCYCDHSLRNFRAWLDHRHGGLGGLNKAWRRRYASWDDVFPGKLPHRTYTDLMEFTRWLMERAAGHTRMRYQALRAGDPNRKHLISAHCAAPAIQSAGGGTEQALCRGNDWEHADALEGFGCSHFPFWGAGFDEEGFGVRVEEVRSANRGKATWVSELQGGSARDGLTAAHRSVPAGPQQRWIANGMARGAKAVIFWCWRDEVFCPESSGFGLAGWDGLAEQRLAAMKVTGLFIDKHTTLIDKYQPDPAKVGVFFAPDNHLLKYADAGSAADSAASVAGYAVALERLGIPYKFVEAYHTGELAGLDVLLMPYCMVLPEAARQAVLKFIRNGGRVLCEAETDSFDGLGFYRYPDERPFMQAIGVHDLGRRQIPSGATLAVQLGEQPATLVLDHLITPLSVSTPKRRTLGGGTQSGSQVLAADEHDQPLLVRQAVGKGVAFVLGSFLGKSYNAARNDGLEALIAHICTDAGVRKDFAVVEGEHRGQAPISANGAEISASPQGNPQGILWRTGKSGSARLLWLTNGGPERTVTIIDQAGKLNKRHVMDLTSGKVLPVITAGGRKQITAVLPDGGWIALEW